MGKALVVYVHIEQIFTGSKSAIETLEKSVKYISS